MWNGTKLLVMVWLLYSRVNCFLLLLMLVIKNGLEKVGFCEKGHCFQE